MNLKNFQILILRNGRQIIQGVVTPHEYNMLGAVISTFPNISELQWYKSEVLNAREDGGRKYTGLNTFECYVRGDACELCHEDDKESTQIIPTDIVLKYIDECIEFHEVLDSGGIPGIIPDSKKEDWVIVPKEYVKEEFWENKTEDE